MEIIFKYDDHHLETKRKVEKHSLALALVS